MISKAKCSLSQLFLLLQSWPDAAHLPRTKDPYNSKSQYAFGPLYTKAGGSSAPVNGNVDVRFIGADESHVMSVSRNRTVTTTAAR